MRRDDGDEIGAAGDIGADLRRAIADIAVDGRANLGVAEIELGRRGDRPRPRRRRPWRPRCSASRTASCCFAASSPAADEATFASAARSSADARSAFCRDPAAVCARSRYRSSSSLANAACAVLASRSALAWRIVVCCIASLRSRLSRLALRAATIAAARSTAARKSRSSSRISSCPARTYSLSPTRICGDEAGDVRRDRRDVAADIGVVGGLDEAPDGPLFIAVARPGQHDEPAQRRVGEPPEPCPRQHAGLARSQCVRPQLRSSPSPVFASDSSPAE